ncbi:hypothetical protein [Pseudalkalibacillus hwajinpoensis]|uniref:Uncharacterized protein n=1 Tax=Guptibacillus hwajinpoensis TaxID=208199 RepID=A0A4U1MP12_9BACL|nr:hypothetical protein [Pseudalkalibacillus hwajinpoensis]TKD72516.1 hypothetical protein FBF83_07000 [Pseudalkalibacillus hwajinpoensis]
MKHSVGSFTHRYSVVHYQTQSAVQTSKLLSKKKVDIRQISQMTGFSEEQILESMEFGDPTLKLTRPTLPKQNIHLEV